MFRKMLSYLDGVFSRECVFDLETDGLLDEVSVIHVLVIRDLTNKTTHVFNGRPMGRPIAEGLALLADVGTFVIAHNGIGYDCLVLKKLHGLDIPWWRTFDTMALSRLFWPELKNEDLDAWDKGRGAFPGQLIGRVSLEAWGHRLGCHKGDYKGDPELVRRIMAEDEFITEEVAWQEAYKVRWASWNQSMEDYCIQDVRVTARLYALMKARRWMFRKVVEGRGVGDAVPTPMPLGAIATETQVAHILRRQEAHGFLFDSASAAKLYAVLVARKLELEAEVHKVFRPRFLADGSEADAEGSRKGRVFTPKKDNKQHGYSEGAPLTKVKLTDFNLSSRDHIETWLRRDFGWQPKEFGAAGKATVDDDVISALPYREAQPLKEYFMVTKRIAAVAEGGEAWLKKVKPDGRMRGRVDPLGTVTYRMTHFGPNMGQVPGGKSPYGHECRALFGVPPGKKLVGADADALELRDLAGYMAIYDAGAYIKTVLEGDKSIGTDMHSVNCRALGLDPKGRYFDGESGRDIAKTWFYAFIYGAGDEKLGYITLRKWGAGAIQQGKKDRAAFLKNLRAMGLLVKDVKARAKVNKYLKGADGRPVPVRSQHGAVNSLMQSAGAIQMKKALCILDDSLQASGLVPGVHYEFVANVHDEWQIEADEDRAEFIGKAARQAIVDAGAFFNFRCPLDGAYDIGNNWSETH